MRGVIRVSEKENIFLLTAALTLATMKSSPNFDKFFNKHEGIEGKAKWAKRGKKNRRT